MEALCQNARHVLSETLKFVLQNVISRRYYTVSVLLCVIKCTGISPRTPEGTSALSHFFAEISILLSDGVDIFLVNIPVSLLHLLARSQSPVIKCQITRSGLVTSLPKDKSQVTVTGNESRFLGLHDTGCAAGDDVLPCRR